MGASSYRGSSYSGKGSTSIRRETKVTKGISEMRMMLGLLEEVENYREAVREKETELDVAKAELKKAEQRVSAQINQLDPSLKAKFRNMLAEMDEPEQEEEEER